MAAENRAAQKRHLRLLPDLTHDQQRPMTRSECVDGPRPCPWLRCRHHLAIEIDSLNGTIKFAYPEAAEGDFEARTQSCSLDVANQGEHTLEEVGALIGDLTQERVRQIQERALQRLEKKMARYR